MTTVPFDRSQLRGEGARRALAGEMPVKPRRSVSVTSQPRAIRRRDARLLVAALVCVVIAITCLYLAVSR